jgi:MerR family transcriptional regulator/heat shock protein HspR
VPERPEHTSLARARSYANEADPSERDAEEGQGHRPDGADDPALGMEGVYIISVAARILDMHPQTLRKYERLGLINPGRTLGMLRLYSREDILKLRLIQRLSSMGLNLAGIEFALSTAESLHRLGRRLQSLAGDQNTINAIDSEIGAVLRRLNLSVDD